MSLKTRLLRWERRLWDDGLLGYIIRKLFILTWAEIKHIPDEEQLWRALNKPDQVYKETGLPKPAFFRDRSGLSLDLARFSTPERSRIGHAEKPYPQESGLVEISAHLIRSVGTNIQHFPIRAPHRNYAHSQLTSVPNGSGLDRLAKEARIRIQQRFKVPSNRSATS